MSDYWDNDDNHPANQKDIEQEYFESDNLRECLSYAIDFNDLEPLENAILKVETIVEKQISKIQLLIDLARSTDRLTYYANKLIAIRKELELIIKEV